MATVTSRSLPRSRFCEERQPEVVPSSRSRPAWIDLTAIAVVAAAMVLPSVFGPVRTNDSFWIDWVWLDQFARELGHGILYPRWLPLSHEGLGSPVFYYYPPLAFYLGSLFVLAGLGAYAAVLSSFFAAYLLSGVGMYCWLKPQSRTPLLGAIIYLVAPYHTFNFYTRGAVAEALATAVIPFVMVGMRRIAKGERRGFAIVALGYAALVMSHLPLALLASLFLIGPYGLVQARANRTRLAITGAALTTGLALAGVYLIPAFLLEPYRDASKLWENPILQPSNWTLWNTGFQASHTYMAALVIAIAVAIPLAGLALRQRSGWAVLGLVCVVLAIGVFPPIWALPLLRSVQFPFRLLPVAEFALATGMATIDTRLAQRIVAFCALLAVSIAIIGSSSPPVVSERAILAYHPDVPENLPPGERPYSWPSRWALQVAASHHDQQFKGKISVEPVFYFPSWRVTCAGRAVPTFADPNTGLLSHRGDLNCGRTVVSTSAEKIGGLLSLLGLGVLLMAILFRSVRRRSGFRTLAPASA